MKTFLVVALFCYFLAMLKFFLHLAVRRKIFYVMAVGIAATGFIMHTLAFFNIAAVTGHGPYTNPSEYTSFFAWTTMAMLLVFTVLFRITAVGAFVSPLAFLLMAYSMLLPESASVAGEQARAFWNTLHYTMSFLALSSFIVVFAAAAMYLIQERELKHHVFGVWFSRIPDLDTLDLLLHRALLFGFPLITVGVASGMIQSFKNYGSLLGPKPERVAPILMVWFIYAVLMAGRELADMRGHRIAVLGIAGFALAVAALTIHLAIR